MNIEEIKKFQDNVHNGSVEAWLNHKKLEWLDKRDNTWQRCSYPNFHLLEYRIVEPKYRPLTPAEMTKYLNKFITEDDNKFIQVNYVGSNHIGYYVGGVLHIIKSDKLMSYRCDGVFLRKEIEE